MIHVYRKKTIFHYILIYRIVLSVRKFAILFLLILLNDEIKQIEFNQLN